ncbi:vesicle transport protein SEC20 isoform X1 [Ictalurus furcatus]|uniref:vesicle transport protein SEC20 isoform X1 n=1 Tax=Ictalurus furcatus TaxID=66913 RepID=UPI00235007B9|nr:vesicle transport protein SEC20 isoform X1 [Ictalurus furcatus]
MASKKRFRFVLDLFALRTTTKMASSSDVSFRICVQEIIKYDLEIKALIQDIRECRGPHSVLMELNAAVKEKSKHLTQRIKDMEQMAKEQDKETDKNSIMAETEGHHKQMLSNQTAWRKANLACKLAIDNLEKDELVHGGDSSLRQRKATKENLTETSSGITESLMSISRLMAQQVKQSEETIGTLATSSRSVLETSEGFKAMTSTIHLGRKLLLKYNRRELTDKLLIFLALALFFATVLYILKKRLYSFI